jgi:hypothetical protein
MRTLLITAALVATLAIQCPAQFFPKSSLGTDAREDSFKSQWYSSHLRALNEPSLLELAKRKDVESYRFLWLRSFHHPVAVRLDVKGDGSSVLVTKMSSGAGGYNPGRIITNTSRELTPQDTREFLSKIEAVGFWNAPNPVDDQRGTDGSQWIIEGVKVGKYHVVDRWSPANGPAYELGRFLTFKLAKLNIPKNEIY